MTEIDVRGLSCPEPVLALQAALDKGNDKLRILASEAHTVKNLTNFAQSRGKSVSVRELYPEYELTVE